MKKRIVSFVLAILMAVSLFPLQNAFAASTAEDMIVDYAYSWNGQYLGNFPIDNVTNSISGAWCCWFTTFCASKVGLGGTADNQTGGLFPPIDKSTWGNTDPNWAATNQSYQAAWMTRHNKGKLYYFSVCTSGRWQINSNTIKSDRSTFMPQKGDLIYFDWGRDGWWDHVAFVANYSNGNVTYIGGNQGNYSQVTEGHISASSTCVVGYLRPNYCAHDWDSAGKCRLCGSQFDFEATLDTSKAGYYTVVKSDSVCPRIGGPYDAAAKESYKLKKNQTVKVIGMGRNHYDNPWYKIEYNNGASIGYVYYSWLEYSRPLESSISINVTWPYEGQTIPKKSHNLIGTVTSSTNQINTVTGYLDGAKVSSVTVNALSFSLAKSDIDYKMPFNALSPGRHTLKIVATDSAGGTQSLTRTFYTESSPCDAATVTTADEHWGGKTVIIRCPGARISYTTSDGDSGNGTDEVRAFIKNTTTFTITTSKSGYSDRVIESTVSVPQVQAPQFETVDCYEGTRLTITSTPGAQIYYYFDGTGHGEYVGPFIETREITVYAYAMKEGMRNSETTSFTIKSSKPSIPDVQLMDTADKVAVGTTAVFKWNADARAKEFYVSLYKDGALLKTATQTSNVYSYVLDTAGKYEVSVKALSPRGDSADSTRASVVAVDPSTVQFVDDDGTLLAKYTVPYGGYVSKQNNPSHKGHYFSGWYPSNNYFEIPVTQDITYKATYTPIEYDVTFYDVDGVKFGETQKVPYQQSATAPDYSANVPAGYVFSGWTVIEASDAESACDYTCVDANLKLQAVIRWENDELPIYAKITSAKVAPEGSDSVYTINVDATNWPSSASNVYLVAALKAKNADTGVYKTVYAERVKVDLSAGQTRSVSIPLHYNGIAKTVEVYALERKGDDTTGSAYSKVISANVVFSTTWTNWSDWSTAKPENAEGRTIESKTQYRYQTKETTTSSNSSLSGWTLYDSSYTWSSYGAWSGWSTNYIASSASTEVETRTGYHYYYYVCSNCGAHMHGYGRCYTWAGGCGSSAVYSSSYHATKAPIPYSNAKDFHGTGVYYTDSTDEGRAFAYISSSSPYYIAPVTQYRYRTRSQIWTYYFYRWTGWSNWSDEKVTATSSRNVETRTLYRYRDEVPLYDTGAGVEDTGGTAYHFTGTINSAQNLTGKVATVMVYQSKNMDPNQYQMQYVGQTTIQAGNQYDISFIPIKEPTIDSGNYVVSLGIQGTTGLLSVDIVEAPKASYTVRFLMDDGSLISTQTVREGENADVPAFPTKTGYRFVGWSDRSTGIYKNVDIFAQFEKMQYTVAFVDWANETIGFHQYYYGDTIEAPYIPTAEGKVFKGWDAILDGNATVKDNMVVKAVYDTKTFTVRFLNENGNVYQEQKVAYGDAATLPEALTVEGKVFLGWSTDVAWWNVTADMDVSPILAYEATTIAPITNAVCSEGRNFISGMMFNLELTSEENATIYYTTDGTEPTRRSSVYNGAIHLEETTIVTAMAVSEGKNDSELVHVYFVHDDTPTEQATETVIPLDTKSVAATPNLEVPLEVELKYNPGLIGYTLILECDRSVFYIDVEDGERICMPGQASKYGTFTVAPYGETGWEITWLSSYPSNTDGTLFTIPLRVGEESETGTYEIKLGYIKDRVYTETAEGTNLNTEMVHFTGADITHEHIFTDTVISATCTEKGYTIHLCFCGESYVDSYVSALGHAWDDGVVTKQSTETTEGVKTFTCTRCDATRTESIPATGDKPCDGGDTCPGIIFTDMPPKGDWAHDAIDWAVVTGITNGTGATTFSPNQGCTRGQVVTFLWRAAGSPEPSKTDNPFKDVKEGAFYYKAVLWAVENGITNGTGATTFSPNETCTRAQIVTFLWRYKGSPEPKNNVSPFTDVTGGYYKAVLWAVENKVTNGTSADKFDPSDTCTRAQIVTFLYRDMVQ